MGTTVGIRTITKRLRKKLKMEETTTYASAVEKRATVERGTEFLIRPALALPKLKRKDVRPTKLVDMKKIARHF